MFRNLFRKRMETLGMFQGHYIDVRVFYAWRFNQLPSISFIGEIDATKAFAFIRDRYNPVITDFYQHGYFDHDGQAMLFNNTIYILTEKRMIELGSNYCMLLHTRFQFNWARGLLNDLAPFRVRVTGQAIGFSRQSSMN